MYRIKNIWIITVLVISSCINENHDLCPDYGKYRVLFYDMYEIKNTLEYYVCIGDKYSIDKGENTLDEYKLTPGTTLLKSDKVLKLYPGKYNFVALQSTERVIFKDNGIKLKTMPPIYTQIHAKPL